jgi:hypothetical protein
MVDETVCCPDSPTASALLGGMVAIATATGFAVV